MKFNLKTPGREDDDVDETTVKLANNNFTEVAKIILEGVGGKENVTGLVHCITRLRFTLKDESIAKDDVLKKMDGVVTVNEKRRSVSGCDRKSCAGSILKM